MWNLKYDTNELIFETDSQSENRPVVAQGERSWGMDGARVWGEQMQTVTYRMDKQQGPTVQHGELYSTPWDKNTTEKNMKKNVYMCITRSLCYTAESNTTL